MKYCAILGGFLEGKSVKLQETQWNPGLHCPKLRVILM